MQDQKIKFKLNKTYGFYEVFPKPTDKELIDYYEGKYYQDENGSYNHYYELNELNYFKNKIAQKDFVVDKILEKNNKSTLLDIGCGEGFTLNYYHKKGLSVLGLDFSDFGLNTNNPHLKPYLLQGDIFKKIQKLVSEKKKFDVLWMGNLLEHVIDPENLIQQCLKLISDKGVLVIEVPNDFSEFQLKMLEEEKIISKYWEAYPDHISYFSYQSLKKLMESNGWKTQKIISDFPVEWYLANPSSNYNKNKNIGKSAHESRMFIENFLHSNQSIKLDDLTNFYESMAKIGQGRQLIGFFTKQ